MNTYELEVALRGCKQVHVWVDSLGYYMPVTKQSVKYIIRSTADSTFEATLNPYNKILSIG